MCMTWKLPLHNAQHRQLTFFLLLCIVGHLLGVAIRDLQGCELTDDDLGALKTCIHVINELSGGITFL